MIVISAAEVVISMIKMYEANYPEILKRCYIINGNQFNQLTMTCPIIDNLIYHCSTESVCICLQYRQKFLRRLHTQQNIHFQKRF